MGRRRLARDGRAVSPVVALVFMAAVVIIVATIVAVVAFGLI